MGSFKALLITYVLGGVTFIPLVVLAVLAHGYYTLPTRSDVDAANTDEPDGIVQPGDDTELLEAAKRDKAKSGADDSGGKARANQDLDVAAGYFAVCREYTPNGINAKPIERSTPVGSASVAPPSPSVYQTMYRSIFDRKPVAGPLDNNSLSHRPKKAGNVFYVVLRHGHLMLFDDDEQLEVRHVISLAHHNISIYSGGGTTPEGELFIKRNSLCLSRRAGPELGPDTQVSRPFYLFSENCSAKEDFYFALLKNQEQTFGYDDIAAPSPKQFDVKSIITLVQKLHSSEDHLHSRWLNALIGRLFLALYKTRDMENLLREKITKKITRVKRPSFLTNIDIQRIDIGEAAPYVTNLKLRDLTVEGECVVEADIKYTGNFRIEVTTTAKIDLGTRFKAREVNLVLAVVLKRIEGHMLFKIKPPPSNRIWFSFQTMPKMEMAIEPIVSSRQITYTVILRQIENRIKEVFAETLVQPFWDDVPFFKTEHKKWRGGIFENDDAVQSSNPEVNLEAPQTQGGDANGVERAEDNQDLSSETRPLEKSYSVPLADTQPLGTGLFGRKLARTGTSSAASVSSTSVDAGKGLGGALSPRSPSIVKNSTDPVVATDAAHADLFKPSSPPDQATNFMAALQSRSQDASPLPTPVGSPAKQSRLAKTSSFSSSSSSKEEASTDKAEEAEETPVPAGRRNTTSSTNSSLYGDGSVSNSPTTSTASSLKNQAGTLGRNLFLRREDSTSTQHSNSSASQKRNTLAAVTNAAVQARQWGWNAIQRQKEARRNGEQANQVDLSQPMGRGQPLPPPGTPLPGPTNGKTKLGPVPNLKRKPVPAFPAVEQQSMESREAEEDVPAAVAPALPQRRRRGESRETVDDQSDNMLVVAAPDDSQPGTPLAEDKPEFMGFEGHGDPVGDGAVPDTSSAAEAGDARPHQASRDIPLPQVSRNIDIPAGGKKVREDDSYSASPSDPPIVAIPAAVTPPEEDEDFSGWMDDESLGDDVLEDEHAQTAVVGDAK